MGIIAIGEGRMVWPPILAAAKAAGVQHYIVELDKYEGDLHAALTRSAANLRGLLAVGKG